MSTLNPYELEVLEAHDIQAKALEEGMPYQTLIASVLHKCVTGKLAEKEPSSASVQRRLTPRSS